MNILVIEDDSHINELIKEGLTPQGFNVFQAYSGSEGLLLMEKIKPDLILLDLMLPGISGEEFLIKVRENNNIPIIVLSAKSDLTSKVSLLNLGANDYMTKPFDIEELTARINVKLREKPDSFNEDITIKDIKLDLISHQAYYKDNNLELTKLEWEILKALVSHPKKTFTKQELYDICWDEYYPGEDKTINVHISNIRQKLKQYTSDQYIKTLWGIGFKINEDL